MSWTSIAWVLPKKIKSLGLENFFRLSEFKKKWDEILIKAVGDKFMNKSKAVNLKNEVLIIDCLNSVWANELKMRESRILEEIKKQRSDLKISKISFIS